MKFEKSTLVTIISEALLEQRITALLTEMAVSGYSLSSVRGDKGGSIRASEWEGENIKIEVLLSEQGAEQLFEQLSQRFFSKNFAVIAYKHSVDVVRGEKFLENKK